MSFRPSPEPPVTEFAGQLFFRLWRATNARTAEVLGPAGLSPALFAVLNVIGAREGIIQQELGSALGIDRSTMVSLIDQLEIDDLAKRRPSRTDRRKREIVITPKGRRVLRRARQLAGEVEDEVLGGLAAQERDQMLTLLRRALATAPPQPEWSPAEPPFRPTASGVARHQTATGGGAAMAKDHGASVKDDKTYEGVRKSGASKEKAARIANAKAGGGNPSKKGGKSSKYEDQTKEQLRRKAADVGIDGRSKMNKGELIDALRNH